MLQQSRLKNQNPKKIKQKEGTNIAKSNQNKQQQPNTATKMTKKQKRRKKYRQWHPQRHYRAWDQDHGNCQKPLLGSNSIKIERRNLFPINVKPSERIRRSESETALPGEANCGGTEWHGQGGLWQKLGSTKAERSGVLRIRVSNKIDTDWGKTERRENLGNSFGKAEEGSQ